MKEEEAEGRETFTTHRLGVCLFRPTSGQIVERRKE